MMEYASHSQDPHAQTDQLEHDMPPVASTSTGRKRASDDPAVAEAKRVKARERQRRKRERDRANMGLVAYHSDGQPVGAAAAAAHDAAAAQQRSGQGVQNDGDMSPAELAKKERIKAAARERQRKHRAVVKAKRMAEMGLAMAVEHPPPPEPAYDPYLAAAHTIHQDHHSQPHSISEDDEDDVDVPQPISEPPFQVQPNATAGQTFASIVLLAFSCAPLLKQHLFRTLNITMEELQSFEPVIAASWDQWIHQRNQYAQQVEEHGDESPYAHSNGTHLHSPYTNEPDQLHPESASDYRQRYQRAPYGHSSGHHPIDSSLNGLHSMRPEHDSPYSAPPEIDPELGHTHTA